MAWNTSTRRERLPTDWASIRRRIASRDHRQCQVFVAPNRKCLAPYDSIDHIKAGDDHSDRNLRAICDEHHKVKSSSEGGVASAQKKRRVNQKFRHSEGHPGLL